MRIIRFCSQRCLVAAGSAAAALIPVTRPAAAQSAPSGAASTATSSVSPAPGSGAGQPPPYTPVRYNEEYRYLQDPALRTDPFDPIKYIPLTDAGDTYLSLGGSARERYEYFHNENFGAGTQDPNGYYLTRLFANADLHVGDALRGFVQLKSSMIDGRAGGPRPQDADEFDVQQAFVDSRLPLGPWGTGGPQDAVTFRFGRQDLLYGAQRLIGPLDWTNVRRTFEGGKAILVTGNNQLDLFWVRPVVVEKEELNNGDGNTSFAGIYDTLALPGVLGAAAGSRLELYGLALNKTKTPAFETAPAVSADSDTYTIGTRFSAAPRPFDLDVEADYQFGQFNAGDLNAWSIAAEGGYTLAGAPFTPRLFLGFDYASGDSDRADRDRQTFNQLFPTGHLYFGYIDVIGRQNIIDVHPGVEVALLKNRAYAKSVTLRAEYHQFWRASTNDAVYNAAGGITRAAVAGNHERSVGGELDLLLNWQIDRHLSSYVGYSHFFTGAYIQDTGPGKDIDFFYAAMQFTF
jgi:Alginate export